MKIYILEFNEPSNTSIHGGAPREATAFPLIRSQKDVTWLENRADFLSTIMKKTYVKCNYYRLREATNSCRVMCFISSSSSS